MGGPRDATRRRRRPASATAAASARRLASIAKGCPRETRESATFATGPVTWPAACACAAASRRPWSTSRLRSSSAASAVGATSSCPGAARPASLQAEHQPFELVELGVEGLSFIASTRHRAARRRGSPLSRMMALQQPRRRCQPQDDSRRCSLSPRSSVPRWLQRSLRRDGGWRGAGRDRCAAAGSWQAGCREAGPTAAAWRCGRRVGRRPGDRAGMGSRARGPPALTPSLSPPRRAPREHPLLAARRTHEER